ncbi:MAG: HAD family phosphatase [Chloroflexi bacterium]|nr:HAD family phosphatase [Chloroflexota bacterium]
MDQVINAVIFDFGNVLVKWDVYALFRRFFPTADAVSSFLMEIGFAEWNACLDAGRPFQEGVRELTAKFPQYTEPIRAYDTFWEESITDVSEETLEIAVELQKAGYELYLLSNFSAEKFPLMKTKYPFLGRIFSDLIISGEYNMIKPDPNIYLLTLKRINRIAAECLFIDDSSANIETARKLGFATILFKSPAQLREELNTILFKTGK